MYVFDLSMYSFNQSDGTILPLPIWVYSLWYMPGVANTAFSDDAKWEKI